jgi:hypothetical protein
MAMQRFRTALLGGIAALALAGLAGTAAAQNPNTHTMKVQLPGGGIAEIRYTGNVPPQIVVTDAPASLAAFDPIPSMFGPDSPFAMMERISAQMDRQAAAMFARAESAAAQARSGSPQVLKAALGNLPPRGAGYSYISTISSNGVCTKSVEITSQGNGAPPKVVSHSSGNCGPQGGVTGPVNLPAARPPANNGPDLILTKANEPKLYVTSVRNLADAQR